VWALATAEAAISGRAASTDRLESSMGGPPFSVDLRLPHRPANRGEKPRIQAAKGQAGFIVVRRMPRTCARTWASEKPDTAIGQSRRAWLPRGTTNGWGFHAHSISARRGRRAGLWRRSVRRFPG